MLVDNLVQPSFFTTPTPNINDFNDFFNTDAFVNDYAAGVVVNNHSSPATASSSRESSPQSPYQSTLLTPPQSVPASSFPTDYASSSFFNFLDDQPTKELDTFMGMSSAPYDFFGAFGGEIGMDGMDVSMDHMAGFTSNDMNLVGESMGIDPQLVGTPSAHSDMGDEEQKQDDHDQDADISASPSSASNTSVSSPPVVKSTSSKSRPTGKKMTATTTEPEIEAEQEKLTLIIQPVKAGGHGRARKGTVQSGGIVKKTASAVSTISAATNKDKENHAHTPLLAPPTYTPPSAFMPTTAYPPKTLGGKDKEGDRDEDDDELPQDWRPSPEVFAKMTSKEKRQLRNKISARNFRVRRKEYISTLEGDIAERDRLLDAIRAELGSTQSENYALRQEIATLKRTLLEGRGVPTSDATTAEFPILNLPPPAPLPATSAAVSLAQQQQQQQVVTTGSPTTITTPSAQQLLTANTQKDASINGRFWGGAIHGRTLGLGGITPVHRVVMPEVRVTDLLGMGVAPGLKENVNPLLNGMGPFGVEEKREAKKSAEVKTFEGFADMNPFTMKSLDAYRMHLWGKMAQQHHAHQAQQHAAVAHHPHLTGLASSLRPAFLLQPAPPTSLSALISGKHSPAPPYNTPSSPPPPYASLSLSPVLLGKGGVAEKLERERERERERQKEKEKEREAAMYAAIASQTLLKKLGGAFWDAFSGSSTSSSSSSSSPAATNTNAASPSPRSWDADKVRRVLEGKAVVRIVDVEEIQPKKEAVPQQAPVQQHHQARRQCAISDMLEESMRSLSLGKKA